MTKAAHIMVKTQAVFDDVDKIDWLCCPNIRCGAFLSLKGDEASDVIIECGACHLRGAHDAILNCGRRRKAYCVLLDGKQYVLPDCIMPLQYRNIEFLTTNMFRIWHNNHLILYIDLIQK